MSGAYYQEHRENWKQYAQKLCPHLCTLMKMNDDRLAMGLHRLTCPWYMLCGRDERGRYKECGGD